MKHVINSKLLQTSTTEPFIKIASNVNLIPLTIPVDDSVRARPVYNQKVTILDYHIKIIP